MEIPRSSRPHGPTLHDQTRPIVISRARFRSAAAGQHGAGLRALLLVIACLPLARPSSLRAQDPPVNVAQIGGWDGFAGTYADVWATGGVAYVAHFFDAGIHLIDISNPADPVLLSEFRVPSPNQFASAQDVKVADGLMFVALESGGADGVIIVDVRDPNDPQPLTTVQVQDFINVHNTFYHEGYLYLANSSTPQVGIVDLTDYDPDNPPSSITTARWLLSNVGTSFVHDITVADGRLYACAWNSGLWVYDITDIDNSAPTLLGTAPGISTHSCWPTPDGRFVVTGEERAGGGIKVFEMIPAGNGLNLLQRDELNLPEDAFSVHNQYVIGYRVYNAWYQAGLQVFDIDPATGELQFAASFDTNPASGGGFDGAWGVFPANADDLILISDQSFGLFTLRIDPGARNEDCNLNGVEDAQEVSDAPDSDVNGNGIPDICEPVLAQDCNGNGVIDLTDIANGTSTDCNANLVPDDCEPGGLDDCDGNGTSDLCELATGAADDCNANLVPDACEVEQGTADDCNGNGVPDACDIVDGFVHESPTFEGVLVGAVFDYSVPDPPPAVRDVTLECLARAELGKTIEFISVEINDVFVGNLFVANAADCTQMPLADSLTIEAEVFNDILNAGGLSISLTPSQNVNVVCLNSFVRATLRYDGLADCNGNGIPDDCDAGTTSADCNQNNIPDECEPDCNGNGIADACDIGDISTDMNGNGVPDECEDCNDNGVTDDVDIANGTSDDENGNGLPDECEDCNGNGILDPEEIASGQAEDCQGNGRPDDCDIADGTSADCNANGIPDACDQLVSLVLLEQSSDGTGGQIAMSFDDAGFSDFSLKMWDDFTLDAPRTLTTGRAEFNESWDGFGVIPFLVEVADMPGGSEAGATVVATTMGHAEVGSNIVEWAFDNVMLPEGAWWLSVRATGGFQSFGTVAWQFANNGAPSGSEAYYHNPGGGWGNGTNPQPISQVNGLPRDMAFTLDGFETDCNNNGALDECDIADGVSQDCNQNQIPDECEPDCNGNDVADACDLAMGTSLDCDVNGVPDECEPDACAPTPDPAVFDMVPAPVSPTAISMSAVMASDNASGVEYQFEFTGTSVGGTSSPWQASRTYTNTGLQPNLPYSYRVRFRDTSPQRNETAPSGSVATVSDVQTPTGIAFGGDCVLGDCAVTDTTIEMETTGVMSWLFVAQSGAFFDSLTPGGDTGINAWVQPAAFGQPGRDTATNLMPDTLYAFRAKGRNRIAIETAFGPSATKATLAAVPGAPVVSHLMEDSLRLSIDANSNPAHTVFAMQCTATPDPVWVGQYVDVAGQPSATPVWQTAGDWHATMLTGLLAGTSYVFAATARNQEMVETAQGPLVVINTCTPDACPAICDLDKDFTVDGDDFSIFLLAFGQFAGEPGFHPDADIDGDGQVTFVDYQGWLACLGAETGAEAPPMPSDAGDLNADGRIDGRDIQPFVETLVRPGAAGLRARMVSDLNGDQALGAADIAALGALLLNPDGVLHDGSAAIPMSQPTRGP